MASFDVCGGCRRHVKAFEPRCPFCGDARPRRPSGVGALPRMSRGAVAALSSMLAAACASDPGASTGQPVVGDDANAADTIPSADDTTPIDSASAADAALDDTLAARDTFDAGPVYDTSACEAETNAWSKCPIKDWYSGFVCGGTNCQCTIDPSGGPTTCYDPTSDGGFADITGACMPCLTCDCFAGISGCVCSTTLDTCAIEDVICHGCYGAPPARTRTLAVS